MPSIKGVPNRGNPNPDVSKLPIPGPGRPKGVKNKLTMARVEQELRKIATLDPLLLFQREEGTNGAVRFSVRDLANMPADARACIARMRVRLEKRGKNEPSEQILEIWFWDKVKALELCAKHFGWVSTKANVLVGRELRELLEEGRRRNAEFRAAHPVIDVTPVRSQPALPPPPLGDVTPTGLAESPGLAARVVGEDDEGDVVI